MRPRARKRASRTAAVLRAHPASSTPVPRPISTTGSVPVSAAINVVAAVVFPMPMSPAMRRSAPASASSSATCIPRSSAAAASPALSASCTAMLPLGLPTDMSTTRTVAPASAASTLMPAPPDSIAATICAVTSAG